MKKKTMARKQTALVLSAVPTPFAEARAHLDRAAAMIAALPDSQLIKQLSDAEKGRHTALAGWAEALKSLEAAAESNEKQREALYRSQLIKMRAVANVANEVLGLLDAGDIDAAKERLVELKNGAHTFADGCAENLPGVWQQLGQHEMDAEGANQNG